MVLRDIQPRARHFMMVIREAGPDLRPGLCGVLAQRANRVCQPAVRPHTIASSTSLVHSFGVCRVQMVRHQFPVDPQ